MTPLALEVMVQKIQKFLVIQHEPCTKKRMFKEVSGRKKIKVAALRLLVSSGRIERTGLGKRSNPYRYSVSKIVDRAGSPIEEIVI